MLINKAQSYKHLLTYPEHRLYPVGYHQRSEEEVQCENAIADFECREKRWISSNDSLTHTEIMCLVVNDIFMLDHFKLEDIFLLAHVISLHSL